METPSFSLALLASAYLLTNILGMAAYLPQILAVCRTSEARHQVVSITWWVWAAGGITEMLYAICVAHQWIWGAIAVMHAVACGVVAILGSCEKWMRWRSRRNTMRLVLARPSPVKARLQSPLGKLSPSTVLPGHVSINSLPALKRCLSERLQSEEVS